MNYEEKVINGVLHRRCSYTDVFKPFTPEELTEMVLKERSKTVTSTWPNSRPWPPVTYPYIDPTITYNYK